MQPYIRLFTLIILMLSASARAQDCPATPHRSDLKHYKPNIAQLRIKVGDGLRMSGHVRSSIDCSPIADAIVEFWQAGKDGKYHDHLRGFTMTLPDGSFSFETEWPNTLRPGINFSVTAGGFRAIRTRWQANEKTDSGKVDINLKPMLSF